MKDKQEMNSIELLKYKKLKNILERQKDHIKNVNDLTAGDDPSLLFYILADKLDYLLEDEPEKCISEKGVMTRRKLNILIKKLGPLFLSNPQIIEKKSELTGDKNYTDEIILPEEPVIWTANHAFKDDTLATILAIKRHAYILFGSVPQFYNTFDGITAWINGVAMANRKVSSSKKASMNKCIKAMEYGADLMMFSEGVWNKTPDKPLLNLWPGIYRISKETGAKVVPVVHYITDCSTKGKDNPIHTVIDTPIKIDDLSEKAALDYIRDILATWYYLMMEKYGQSTREEELSGYNNSIEAWEQSLRERVKTASRYDIEIETTADYRPKDQVNPEEVWTPIANIKNINVDNINQVIEAKKLVKQIQENDFQRRF